MGLETGTYLDDLVRTNPLGTDDRSTADDHLRLIKDFLLNTFPNLDAACNMTPTELNKLVGLLATAAELNALNAFVNTANRALITNGSGQIIVAPNVTAAELDFINSLSENVQTALDGKASSAHSHTSSEISALDVSDITTGVFALAFIPSINEAKLLDGSVTAQKIADAESGTERMVQGGPGGNSGIGPTSPVNLGAQVQPPYGGTFQFEWIHRASAGGTTFTRIYRNGSAVGVQKSTTSIPGVTVTDTVSGWSAGDDIQMFGYNNGAPFSAIASGSQLKQLELREFTQF